MKVIRNTQDELVLESRPWGAGIVVIMLTLGVLGAGLTVFMNGSQVSGLVIILFGGILSLSAFWAFVRLEEVRLRPQSAHTSELLRRATAAATSALGEHR